MGNQLIKRKAAIKLIILIFHPRLSAWIGSFKTYRRISSPSGLVIAEKMIIIIESENFSSLWFLLTSTK